MRMKVKSSELRGYQQVADIKMIHYKSMYEMSVAKYSKDASLLSRFLVKFKYPLSLRMFDNKEYLIKDKTDKKEAVVYRDLWHDYWSIKNLTVSVPIGDERVWLNEFETGVVMNIREYDCD